MKKLFRKNTSIQKAFIVSLAVFFAFLLIGPVIGRVYTSYLAGRAEKILRDTIASDSKNLFEQGNRIAESNLLKDYVSSGDSYRILGFLNQEKEASGDYIDLIGATDKDGFVISRNQTAKGLGDNVFISTAVGRLLTENIATSSIEIRGIDPTQLLIATGRPIIRDGSIIGSLFTNKILGDEYTQKLKAKLPFRTEAVFYTQRHGVCGMSLESQLTRKSIQTYLNPDSDFIKNGKTGYILSISYGNSYLLKNIVFPGLERSPGGVILLIPNYASSVHVQIFAVFFSIITFISLAFIIHRNRGIEEKGKLYYSAVIATFILLCTIIFFTNTAYFIDYIRSKKSPVVLYNSTLRLSPDSGTFNSEFESNISILVNSGEESVNAFNVGINFDPNMIQIENISIESSVCDEFLEKNIDNEAGKIRIACIVVNPGFIGRNGNVADIVFKIKKHGQVGLVFDRDTEVLANDGLGTSVLRTALSGSYHAESLLEAPREDDGSEDWMSVSPDVYSATHPNSERWYARNTAEFRWSNSDQGSFVYSFDQSSTTIPSASSTTTDSKFSEKVSKSGVYYFHLARMQDGKMGPVTHYKIMIDIDGPKEVFIRPSATEVEAGDIVRLVFGATSSYSGLQRAFYLNMGGGSELFYPVRRETYVPMLDPLGAGIQKITLRVFDEAGNFVDRTIDIKVKGSPIRNFINWIFNSL